MATIVVCEDDASTRALITAVLSKAGHQVEAFDNGLMGFVRLLEGDVELLVSDVQMPGKDGFSLVADVRQDKQLLHIPCILLTSLQERAHMRVGMTSGADDYVTKPFQPSELIEAVDGQLKRAMQVYALHEEERQRSVNTAVGQRTNELMRQFEERLRSELQSRWAQSDMASQELSGMLIACVIAQQDEWLKHVSSSQMADMARHFFNKVSDCAALFNADHLQVVGDGLLIVFDEVSDTPSTNHAGRALRLVRAMESITGSMLAYIQGQLQATVGDKPLPPFACSLVLHKGKLSLAKLDGVAGGIEQLVPIGLDVQLLTKLLKAGLALRWRVLLSQTAVSSMAKHRVELAYQEHVDIKLAGQTLHIYRAQ